MGNIRDIDVGNGNVWSGSNGGVLQLQINNQEITKFTNTDGLTINEVVAVELDKHGSVWFALNNGVLNRYWPDTGQWDVTEDYKDQTINDMVSIGDSLYIAIDVGVSLFLIDKEEVKETYENLGLSSGQVVEKIGANSVSISGHDIWVSTNNGIAKSSLTFSNLQAPANWSHYTKDNGLQTNIINKIIVLDSIPYAATDKGVERFVNGQWENVGSLEELNVPSISILESNSYNPSRTVVIYNSNGVFLLESDQWSKLNPGLSDITALKTDEDGNLWIGRKNLGLAKYSFENKSWESFEINSPASNNFKSMVLDSKGRLWCASEGGGIHMLEGNWWTNYSTRTGLKSNNQQTVLVDARDRIWFGSWGGGVTIFEDSSDGFSITQIDTADGILAGSDTPGFVVINSLTSDQLGNIWMLNRETNNTQVVAVKTPDDRYAYFSSTFQEIGTVLVRTIKIDRGNRVWIGTDDKGVKVIDYNNTLFDKNDDDFSQGLNSSEGLFSDRITAFAEDQDGVMWIGTEEGVNNWFQGDVRKQFGLINNSIITIGVDARNNKWFGTAEGVSVLSHDGVSMTHYTPGNFPLVSERALSFAFNEEVGEVWIGTNAGLTRLKAPFTTAPKENLDLLTGYPNPFEIIEGQTKVFTITNLALNTKVVIYTAAGKKVRSFNTVPVFWNGNDENNNLVPSGIYIYLAYTDNGISASGKVAVIRR